VLHASKYTVIDAALSQIQAEREPEIVRVQELQNEELTQGQLLIKSTLLQSIVSQLAPLTGKLIRQSWLKRQHLLRQGVTKVKLTVE